MHPSCLRHPVLFPSLWGPQSNTIAIWWTRVHLKALRSCLTLTANTSLNSLRPHCQSSLTVLLLFTHNFVHLSHYCCRALLLSRGNYCTSHSHLSLSWRKGYYHDYVCTMSLKNAEHWERFNLVEPLFSAPKLVDFPQSSTWLIRSVLVLSALLPSSAFPCCQVVTQEAPTAGL